MQSYTQISVIADVVGAFWWPIGEPWVKHSVSFDVTAYQRRCVNGGRAKGITLREAIDGMETEHGGDSSEGIKLANGIVKVTRVKGNRKASRVFDLSLFPSIADYITEEEF